ncbi:hypothetical protein HMPREF0043_01689 [Actinobaculum sp. oral taxon 183 str. F0552]|nr:hypothetical protein HMPREF0043_01689 [Actinobaculum sp. oral taxon 183 str. F0552]
MPRSSRCTVACLSVRSLADVTHASTVPRRGRFGVADAAARARSGLAGRASRVTSRIRP